MLAVIASDCCAVTPSFAVLPSIASGCCAVMPTLDVLVATSVLAETNASV